MKISYKLLQQHATGLLSVLLFAVCMVAMPQTAFAAEEDEVIESVTLAPDSSRFKIDAGQTYSNELTILNDGSVPYDLMVYARPYSVTNESYDPDFTGTPSNADAYQWVQFAQTNWHVKAGETLKIPYTIRVPKTAAPGGHYGVIFAETQPKEATTTSVVRKKRVGSIIYATVNGAYKIGGQSLGTEISPLQFRAPLSASTTLENTGNADFEVETTYQVSDVFGNVKYKIQKKNVLLPATARKISLEWADAPWLGLFKVSVDAKFLDQSSHRQSFVLLVPRWLLLVLAVAAIGGAGYATLRYRRR